MDLNSIAAITGLIADTIAIIAFLVGVVRYIRGHREVGRIIMICVALLVSCATTSGLLYVLVWHHTGASARPQTTLIYRSDLTTASVGWFVGQNCFFNKDGYHVKADYVCFAPVNETPDMDISVQVRQVAGSTDWAYGIWFHYSSQTRDHYEFDIASNGAWVFFKCADDTSCSKLSDNTDGAVIHGGLNTTNTIEVRTKGSDFGLYVNGTKVGEVDDLSLPVGEIGVGVSGDIECVFSNFVITSNGPNATPAPTPVTIYTSTLTSTEADWYTGSQCFFRPDGYHITGNYYCTAPVGQQADVSVSVQVQQIAGDKSTGYGILVGRRGSGNSETWHEFDINSSGKWTYFVCTITACNPLVDLTASNAIKTGLKTENALEVHIRDKHLDFYVNGTKVGQADDSDYSGGDVALSVSGNIECVFSNLTIARP